jgi:hypothetical protein
MTIPVNLRLGLDELEIDLPGPAGNAPRTCSAGLSSRRPVAIAYRKIRLHFCNACFAVSNLSPASTRCKHESTSTALGLAMRRAPIQGKT